MPSTVRFLRQFLRPDPEAVVLEESSYERGDKTLPASLYRPTAASTPLPGWVALHGLTYRGRRHESLDSFARALAASGTVVLIPDMPDWRELYVAPATAVKTIKAAVLELDSQPDTASGRIGVIGFSFGGTQALTASTDLALTDHLAAVASWGGYADMERTVRFAFLGNHELDGVTRHLEPDPYGRWILAGNYLTAVPELSGAHDLQAALLDLAREVGRRKILAWLPATDPLKAERRTRLAGRDRELFDLMAPATTRALSGEERDRLAALAGRLARAAIAMEPLLDPTATLPHVHVPVFLAHGREDRLMPWTELHRLRRALPDHLVRHAIITRLFAHSFRERRFPTPSMVVEALRFVRAIHRMVHLT